MVGGYSIRSVVREQVTSEFVREYLELVREREQAVDEEWGGRPLTDRLDYSEPTEPRNSGREISTRWLEPGLLELLDEEAIDMN